jgi:hypothetical protein
VFAVILLDHTDRTQNTAALTTRCCCFFHR